MLPRTGMFGCIRSGCHQTATILSRWRSALRTVCTSSLSTTSLSKFCQTTSDAQFHKYIGIIWRTLLLVKSTSSSFVSRSSIWNCQSSGERPPVRHQTNITKVRRLRSSRLWMVLLFEVCNPCCQHICAYRADLTTYPQERQFPSVYSSVDLTLPRLSGK